LFSRLMTLRSSGTDCMDLESFVTGIDIFDELIAQACNWPAGLRD
jgi:hypothetical protein